MSTMIPLCSRPDLSKPILALEPSQKYAYLKDSNVFPLPSIYARFSLRVFSNIEHSGSPYRVHPMINRRVLFLIISLLYRVFQVGDLLMAIITMIPNAVSMLRGTHAWISDAPFGQVSCKLLLFSQGTSMACSIFTLTALALERFFAVVFPIWKVVTIKRTRWLIIFIWMASFASTAPMLYAAKVKRYDGIPFCVEDWAPAFDPKLSQSIFTIVSFVFLYALPLLVISVLYSIIIARVWGRDIPGNATPANQRLLNKSKKNVLKMLITVVLAFALCWFLLHLNLFLMDFSDVFSSCGIPIGLQTTGFLFGHANSAINCCIYMIFSQDFRRGLKEILKPFLPNRSGTLLVENTRAGSSMEATVVLKTSYRSGKPQVKSFKIIQERR